jgi:DNA-binding MarR family transcriptional regulator
VVWCNRANCGDDARGALVSLTPQGLATLRQAAPLHVRSVRRHLVDLLTEGELEALSAISAKVVGHFDAPADLKEP